MAHCMMHCMTHTQHSNHGRPHSTLCNCRVLSLALTFLCISVDFSQKRFGNEAIASHGEFSVDPHLALHHFHRFQMIMLTPIPSATV
eukprot:1148926-Pelagomonas_calceolata.AAC.4